MNLPKPAARTIRLGEEIGRLYSLPAMRRYPRLRARIYAANRSSLRSPLVRLPAHSWERNSIPGRRNSSVALRKHPTSRFIPIKKAKIMASVVTLLTVDIVGLLAALSIWTASFVLLLRIRIPSVQ
jgi:hypothetical protein